MEKQVTGKVLTRDDGPPCDECGRAMSLLELIGPEESLGQAWFCAYCADWEEKEK